jgi:DNA-nicking Smr family endonuclease
VSGRKPRGPLTSDDEDVWGHVKRQVHPLRRGSGTRVPEGVQSDLPSAMPASQAKAQGKGKPGGKSGGKLPGSKSGRDAPEDPNADMPDLTQLATPSAGRPRWQPFVPQQATPRPKTAAPAPAAFDKRHARKIATGKVEIEGRLDLHGLRESEAHVRLRGFLRQAQAQGKRTVLVITGKGREGDDDPTSPYDFGHDRSPRGVLKRNVPRWLAGPDLSPLVVSFTTAHTRHGGEGALYVHLRRG